MKVGVIGAGHWGVNLVRNFAGLGVLAGVADPREENRDRVLSEFPGTETFEDERALLDAGYGAVAIATPASTHFEIACQALESGADVFVEKPMVLDPEEARHLNGLALEADRILMVGHLLLYQPAITFMADYLRSGKLGQIYTMHQRRSKLHTSDHERRQTRTHHEHDGRRGRGRHVRLRRVGLDRAADEQA